MSTNDGGPAFPVPDERDPVTGAGLVQGSPGMSLRDWFAGQALPALAAYAMAIPVDIKSPTVHDVAEKAYLYADAMIKARG